MSARTPPCAPPCGVQVGLDARDAGPEPAGQTRNRVETPNHPTGPPNDVTPCVDPPAVSHVGVPTVWALCGQGRRFDGGGRSAYCDGQSATTGPVQSQNGTSSTASHGALRLTR